MMKKLFLTAAMLLAAGGLAHAEKADSTKPTKIDYEDLLADDVHQTKTLIGNVVLTRGTLLLKSPRAVVTTDPEGYNFVVLTGTPGTLATFRQKRDGEGEQWVDGEAERIEYDDKTDLVKLFSKAKVRRTAGGRLSDEVECAFISYDSRKEQFSCKNTVTGETKPGAGRGSMIIQPPVRPAAAPAAGAAAAASAASAANPAPGK